MAPTLYQFINRHPEIDYHLPPELNNGGRRALQQAQADIDHDPRLFAGPVAMVTSFDSQLPAFSAFPADYRWALAANNDPRLAAVSSGMLGVHVAVCDAQGRYLYQRRSELVSDSWCWAFGVSGKVAPARGPAAAAADCLQLKLGLAVSERQLQPQAIIVFRGLLGYRVLYQVIVERPDELEANSDYLEDFLWAETDNPPADLLDSSWRIQEINTQRQHWLID